MSNIYYFAFEVIYILHLLLFFWHSLKIHPSIFLTLCFLWVRCSVVSCCERMTAPWGVVCCSVWTRWGRFSLWRVWMRPITRWASCSSSLTSVKSGTSTCRSCSETFRYTPARLLLPQITSDVIIKHQHWAVTCIKYYELLNSDFKLGLHRFKLNRINYMVSIN